MILLDLLLDFLGFLVNPLNPDREFSRAFLFGMVLLIAAGAGALYYFTRQ